MLFSAFDQLQVPVTASDEEIKAAYLALVCDSSPDSDPIRFQTIREAYEAIANQESRDNYLLFTSPVLGLYDALKPLMKKNQSPNSSVSRSMLTALIKEALHAK